MHLLHWTWLEYGRRVLIITCVELEGLVETPVRRLGRPEVKGYTRGSYEDAGDASLNAEEEAQAQRQIV